MLRTYLFSIISSGEAPARKSALSRGVLPVPNCPKARVRTSSLPSLLLFTAVSLTCA